MVYRWVGNTTIVCGYKYPLGYEQQNLQSADFQRIIWNTVGWCFYGLQCTSISNQNRQHIIRANKTDVLCQLVVWFWDGIDGAGKTDSSARVTLRSHNNRHWRLVGINIAATVVCSNEMKSQILRHKIAQQQVAQYYKQKALTDFKP